MRKLTAVICAVAVLATACKTTEANYRAAYEKTIEARRESQSVDSTVYGEVRRQGTVRPMTVGDTTVDVRIQRVRVTDGGGGIRENLHRYNVVVGQFKQRFNAISLRDRLVDAGYPAAFVVETAEPYYYIIGASADDLSEAYASLKAFEANPPVPMKAPLPFLLSN